MRKMGRFEAADKRTLFLDEVGDLPLLVCHFVDEYARRMNRRIETIPSHAMEALTTYSWPGNVRAPLGDLKQAAVEMHSSEPSTLEEMEREHVLRAVRGANWKIGGPNGAAARLGMKRTTLAYRIRKLNISLRPQ